MKLHNKKTGEIGVINLKIYGDDSEYVYDTIETLYKEWEDYTPAEPLIKDEKIRMLVREWTEINGIETVLVCQTFNAWGFKNKESGKAGDKEYMLADILFKGEKPEELEFGKEYAIIELCGEEEE